MKVIELANLKALCNVTFTAQDTKLTMIANGVESDVEKYMGRGLETLTDAEQTSIEFNLMAAAHMRWMDPTVDIWAKGILARALFPFRVPAIGVATS